MNKLSKIFLLIIVLLVIALSIMTFSYFKMKKFAQDNLNLYLNAESEITQLHSDYQELKDEVNK